MENETQLLIPPSLYKYVPPMVRSELAKMSAQKQDEFLHEYTRKAKGVGAAYVFLFLLGAHYAYLGRWGMQILFWLTGGGFIIWWFIDLFRVPGVVAEHNQDSAMAAMRNLKAIS